MPRTSHPDIPLHGLVVTDAQDGSAHDLGDLVGVSAVVLMRHRH